MATNLLHSGIPDRKGEDNVLPVLEERGFLAHVTSYVELQATLEHPTTLYWGIDPTANSLHLGQLIGIMAMTHFRRAGHNVIALVGGGTALIGDPTGKLSIRPALSLEQVQANLERLGSQLNRFLGADHGGTTLLNNADWLADLSYMAFLRDVGRHFSVNSLLSSEVYKNRLSEGLNFIELNYMLLQAYDFLHLYRNFGCRLQIGGSDQWANCLAGNELIRRTEQAKTFTLVWPLLTTASGAKMGKTEAGAVWLDPDLTAPYDFYQYWINIPDMDTERFLKLFTFLPIDEIEQMSQLQGADKRQAKQALAYEVTKFIHGPEAAEAAQRTSARLFRSGDGNDESLSEVAYEISKASLQEGIPAFVLFSEAFGKSRREARSLISAQGAYFNGKPVEPGEVITEEGVIRWGKKHHRQLVAEDSHPLDSE